MPWPWPVAFDSRFPPVVAHRAQIEPSIQIKKSGLGPLKYTITHITHVNTPSTITKVHS